MTAPGNQNPASSLPQQDHRWTVIEDRNPKVMLANLHIGDSAFLFDIKYAGFLKVIANAHNATLSEPKPEKKEEPQKPTFIGMLLRGELGLPKHHKGPQLLVEPDALSDNAQAVLQNTLSEFIAAAKRIETGGYTHWTFASGVNNCTHGYGEGVPCPKCDRETVKTFVVPSVVAGVGEHAMGVSSDEEIAREAANAFLRQHGDGSLQGFLYLDLLEAFQVAIHKAKSVSEPKESVIYPAVCTNCWRVQKDAETCAHCHLHSLQPVIDDLLQPKELEKEKHD